MTSAIRISLSVLVLALGLGCIPGPRLRVSDVRVESYTDTTISYTVTIENQRARGRLSRCRPATATGLIHWGARMSSSPSGTPDDESVGSRNLVGSTGSPYQELRPGQSDTYTFHAARVEVDPSSRPYLNVLLQSRATRRGPWLENVPCKQWTDRRSIEIPVPSP